MVLIKMGFIIKSQYYHIHQQFGNTLFTVFSEDTNGIWKLSFRLLYINIFEIHIICTYSLYRRFDRFNNFGIKCYTIEQ